MRALAIALAVAVPGTALADSTSSSPGPAPDEPRPSRTGFYVALSLTAVGVVGTVASYRKVQRLEAEKEDLLRDAGEQGLVFDTEDACADADGRDEPIAGEISSTCASGRRWATATNIFAYATVLSAAATVYLGFRAFKPRRRDRQAVTVTPRVGGDGVAVDLSLHF